MTTTSAPAPIDWVARRAEREAELLAAFDPRVPGMDPATDGLVLHEDHERGLTYRWWNISRRTQDFTVRERGYLISQVEVTYRTPDGRDLPVARLNVSHTTKELVSAQFPTVFHWADENTSATFGFAWKREPLTDADIWASAYTNLSREIGFPPSVAGLRSFGSFSASQAPTDPRVLAAEIKVAEKHYAKMMRGFLRCQSVPSVDYSHVDDNSDSMRVEGHPGNLRGTGVGRMMYLLAARHLGTHYGKVLRASGLQSNEAQALWDRLVADPTVPTRKVQVTFYRPVERPTKTYWCLDYTRTR